MIELGSAAVDDTLATVQDFLPRAAFLQTPHRTLLRRTDFRVTDTEP